MSKRHLGVLLALLMSFHRSARAQALSLGVDGGITISDPPIEFVDPAVTKENALPTIALGFDVAGYYLFTRELALGGTFTAAFYTAGPKPSAGVNFMLGPRFVWRPAWFHLATDGGVVVSAFDDRCAAERATIRAVCPQTQRAERVGVGFGFGLAPLFRVWTNQAIDLLLGPAARYQWAHYSYTKVEGSFALQNWQTVIVLRLFADVTGPH